MKGSNMAAGYGFISPNWQDGEPVFTHQDTVFIRAVDLGCTPVYHEYSWRCHCSGATHGISTFNTEISLGSLNRVARESRQ
jgi:hypothetical protein